MEGRFGRSLFIGGSMAATKLSTSKALVSTGAAASKASGKGVLSILSTFKSQIVKKFAKALEC